MAALSSPAQASRQAERPRALPAPTGRIYFCLVFILATNNGRYSQHPISPRSSSPPAFTWRGRKHGRGQEEDGRSAAAGQESPRTSRCSTSKRYCAVKQHLPSPGLSLGLQAGFAWGDNSTCIVFSFPLQKLGLHTRKLLLWPDRSLFLLLLFLLSAGCWSKT